MLGGEPGGQLVVDPPLALCRPKALDSARGRLADLENAGKSDRSIGVSAEHAKRMAAAQVRCEWVGVGGGWLGGWLRCGCVYVCMRGCVGACVRVLVRVRVNPAPRPTPPFCLRRWRRGALRRRNNRRPKVRRR